MIPAEPNTLAREGAQRFSRNKVGAVSKGAGQRHGMRGRVVEGEISYIL